MIIKKDCNKTNCSSIYKEVIRPVLNFLLFFTIRFHIFLKKHQKAPKGTKKHQKAPKGTKRHQKAPKGTKSTTNLRFIKLKFINTRFDISLSSLKNI